MKHLLVYVAIAAAVVLGVRVMADATQNRPDEVSPDSTSTVDYTVSTRDFQRGEPAAAQTLWSICSATVPGEASAIPEHVGDHWRVTISPSLGEHGSKRLLGCLEDLTVDRVVGTVVAVTTSG